MPWGATVKVISSFGCCSFLYIVFAVLIVCRGLDIALAAVKYIRIVIGGVVVAIVIALIYQLGSLSNSNLNFALTI